MRTLYVRVDGSWVLSHRDDDDFPMAVLADAMRENAPSDAFENFDIQLTEIAVEVRNGWDGARCLLFVEEQMKTLFEDWSESRLEVELDGEREERSAAPLPSDKIKP